MEWDQCHKPNCEGASLNPHRFCLGHLATENPQALELELDRFHRGGILDARGVTMDPALLRRILDAVPYVGGQPKSWQPRFARAHFGDDVDFTDARFGPDTQFTGAVFGNNAKFNRARFGDRVDFTDASFGADTQFSGAVFGADTQFTGAVFGNNAKFEDVILDSRPRFNRVAFTGGATISKVAFGEGARFNGVQFGMRGRYEIFKLESVTLEGTPELIFWGGHLEANSVYFPDGVTIETDGTLVSLGSVRFGGRSTIIRFGSTSTEHLLGASFPKYGTAIVAGLTRLASRSRTPEPPTVPDAKLPARPIQLESARPRILALPGTDASRLTLVDADLRACRFGGAYNLDQLHIEGSSSFPHTPRGWRFIRVGGNGLPAWRWTSRSVLADEHRWRFDYADGVRNRGWYPPECDPYGLGSSEKQRTPDPTKRQERARSIAQSYRALRKGLEDWKDEPGAADFYYGEMEMRRAGTPRGFERALLSLYWLVSGYGLRASRSLAILLMVILVGAVVFATIGFPSPNRIDYSPVGVSKQGSIIYEQKCVYGTLASGQGCRSPSVSDLFPVALAFSAESTTSLLRPPVRDLTTAGEWAQVILRLLGPLFFALTVLAMRGRVKR
jgi:pentapeptide repeat protein